MKSFVARLRPRSDPQAVAGVLTELLDAEECALSVFEDADGDWLIEIFFGAEPDAAHLRTVVAQAVGAETAETLTIEPVAARDWVAASLAGLTAVQAGRFVVHGAHGRDQVSPSRIGIEIEAALAFGTGHHGTTRGCLLALDTLLRSRQPRRVLDVGTGTGVLAIAAARALRAPVLASDIDAMSVRIARGNARANRAEPFTTFVHAAGLSAGVFRRRGPYDLILANILLRPLQRLAHPIARAVAPGGHVILSGLMDAQGPAAIASYRAQGLVLRRILRLDGWTTLVLARASVRRHA